MKKSSPKGPIILSDCLVTNVKANIISSGGSLPPFVSLTNFNALHINNIIVQDILMSNGIVTGVSRINDIIIESHVSRHIIGGQDTIPISFSIPSEIDDTANAGTSNDIPKADHVHAHGNQVGGTLHAVATSVSNGFMSSSDKIILDQIAPSNNIPGQLGISYIGISNEYSRPDHVHAHGNQIGGTLHSVVTDSSNGFMLSGDKSKINNFSWNQSDTTLTLNQGHMNISSQPFGYLSSDDVTRAVVSGIQTALYNYYTTQNTLNNIALSGGKFVVVYPGIYLINATISTTLQLNQGSIYGFICVNNIITLGTDFYSFNPSSELGTINMSAIVKLVAQDIVYATIYQNTGFDMTISSAEISNRFSIKLLYGNGQPGSSLPRWNQATFTNIASLSGISVAMSFDGTIVVEGRPGTLVGPVMVGNMTIYTKINGQWTITMASLTGTGYSGNARIGFSVAISADNTTIVAGGPIDSSGEGAVWVFIWSGGTWVQQGSKLVGTGNIGPARQGSSVALSYDGNTLAQGGRFDSSGIGAVWIFTRSGTTWSQQTKLVGTGGINIPAQGFAVSLSSDGNTIAIGAPGDNTNIGGTWVFIRVGTVWSQQAFIIASDNIGTSRQGISVSLSSNGNTLAIGGNADNGLVGATWIYIRSGITWTNQAKLVATGIVGEDAAQGTSVIISSDGNTLAIGGDRDNLSIGAVWIFTLSGITWTQQYKVIGYQSSDPLNIYEQGGSIGMDGGGNAIVTGSDPASTNTSNKYIFIFDRN